MRRDDEGRYRLDEPTGDHDCDLRASTVATWDYIDWKTAHDEVLGGMSETILIIHRWKHNHIDIAAPGSVRLNQVCLASMCNTGENRHIFEPITFRTRPSGVKCKR